MQGSRLDLMKRGREKKGGVEGEDRENSSSRRRESGREESDGERGRKEGKDFFYSSLG